jgi:hypothetical protein
VHGEQPALAEVALDQPREPGALVEVEHPSGERRRVRRQHAAALLDPRALGDLVALLGDELLVEPVLGPAARVARRQRAVDPGGELQRVLARHEPAHEQAAVAQDAGAQQPRRDVGRRDLGQPAGRQRSLVGRGVVRRALARVDQAHPGEVAQPQQLALGLRAGLCPPLLAQAADLLEQVLGRRLGDGDGFGAGLALEQGHARRC